MSPTLPLSHGLNRHQSPEALEDLRSRSRGLVHAGACMGAALES